MAGNLGRDGLFPRERRKSLKLRGALGISNGETVAFIGAGGKSGAILALAKEIYEDGGSVLAAPTTKMFLEEAGRIGPVVTSENSEELFAKVEKTLTTSRAVVAGRELLSKGRVGGLDPAWVPALSSLADVALIEADGSRRRPLKGTSPHEPVLPEAPSLVVAVGNVRALGKPVNEEFVHRPEVFSELTGVGPGQSITAGSFARALVHGLGKAPAEARKAILLTGVEPGKTMSDSAIITREIWRLGERRVILGFLAKEHPNQVWIP